MAVSFGKNVDKVTQNTKNIFELFSKADFKKPMCLDIETTGLNRFKDGITTIQLGYFEQGKSKIERFFLEVSKFTDDEIKTFLRGLLNARLITHNGKFDILFLEHHYGIKLSVWQDTLLMAHVCGEEELGLKYLVKKYFGVNYDIDTELKKGKVTQALIDYALDDVYYPFKLFKIFKKKIIDEKLKNIYKHELRVYKAYIEVERTGIPISPRRHQIAKEVKEKYTVILDRLLKVANINWNSTDQLATVMFTELDKPIYGKGEKLPNTYDVLVDNKIVKTGFISRKEAVSYAENLNKPSVVKLVHNYEKKVIGRGLGLEVKEYTSTGKPSVGVSVLSEYRGNPVIDDLLEYKKLVKLETFIVSWEKLQYKDRIYPSFNITARTGRTTCNNPNLQQVPQDSRIRNLIEAREGYVVIECDYSQAELRVMAWLSGDENMQKAYNSGSDLHESTMNLIYGDNISQDHDEHKRQRTLAKACFSGDTEILTEDGFTEFRLYDGVTPVAQYNIDSQEISYTKPLDFRMIPNQKICVFENENTSLKLTPEHECIVKVIKSKKYMTKVPFKDLAGHGQARYAWVNAGYFNYDKNKFIDDDLTRFIACFVADGSYGITRSSIRFGFSKERKISRFRDLINRLNIVYKEKVQDNGKVTTFIINDFKYVTLVKRYCSVDKDLLKPSMSELNPKVYLEEASYWDGHVNHTNLITISSVNKHTLECMQIMAIQSGIRARLYKNDSKRGNRKCLWTLSYNFNKKPISVFISDDIKLNTNHNTNHNVYCVTVPEHNIVIRHNGKVSIQGNCNFGMVYGGQPQTLVNYIKSWGVDLPLDEAKKLHKAFFEAYPKLIEFYDYCKDYTRCYGYIRSPLGRKRWLPNIYSMDWKKKSSAERQCVNSPVQGMASDICVSALADIVFSEELDHSKFTVLGSVHDAILIECKEEYAEYLGQEVAKIMSKPTIIKNLDVPIPFKGDVEIHKSWGG